MGDAYGASDGCVTRVGSLKETEGCYLRREIGGLCCVADEIPQHLVDQAIWAFSTHHFRQQWVMCGYVVG